MPSPDTYYVQLPDGSRIGPLTTKGLVMQLKRGLVKRDYLIEHDDWEVPITIEVFMKQQAEADPHHKTALPPLKMKPKAKLPPVKSPAPTSQECGTEPAPDDTAGGFDSVPFSHAPHRHPLSTGWATLFCTITAMLFALSLFHLVMANSIADSMLFGRNIYVKLEEYHYLDSMCTGFFHGLGTLNVIVFLLWVRRATANVQELTADLFPITPASMVISYLIPVVNLWTGYACTRSLLNASLNPAGPFRKCRPFVLIWWFSIWVALIYRASLSDRSVETLDDAKRFLAQVVYADCIYALAALLSIIVVYLISAAQRENYARAGSSPGY